MDWLRDYLRDILISCSTTFYKYVTNLFTDFWEYLKNMLLGVVLVPLGYFIFRPVFRLTFWLMEMALNKAQSSGNMFILNFTELAAWVFDCLRIQDIFGVVCTYIAVGLMIKLISRGKKAT